MVDQITARTECMDAQAHLRLHAISIGFVTDQRPMRAGEQIKQTPGWPPSPSMGASGARSPATSAEATVNTECTGRMVFFSRSSLERALTHYMAHYHEERNHRGLQNRSLKRFDHPIHLGGRVERRKRLGGMLNFHCREAA